MMSGSGWRKSARILTGAHAGRYLVQVDQPFANTLIYTVVPGQLPVYVTTATAFGNYPGGYDVEPDDPH